MQYTNNKINKLVKFIAEDKKFSLKESFSERIKIVQSALIAEKSSEIMNGLALEEKELSPREKYFSFLESLSEHISEDHSLKPKNLHDQQAREKLGRYSQLVKHGGKINLDPEKRKELKTKEPKKFGREFGDQNKTSKSLRRNIEKGRIHTFGRKINKGSK